MSKQDPQLNQPARAVKTLRQQCRAARRLYEFWRNPINAAPRPPDVASEIEMRNLALRDWRAIEVEIAKENRAKRKAKWIEQQKRRHVEGRELSAAFRKVLGVVPHE